MLQKPLPLLLILPPRDSSPDPAACLPIRSLFGLQERVVASFFPKAPAAISPSRARAYKRAVRNRLARLADNPLLRAGVQCSLSSRPLEPSPDDSVVSGKLVLRNLGDEYGEEGSGPVTCPPQVLRDLRDLAAARLADWPGGVLLNQGSRGGEFIAGRRGADRLPWVCLEFSSRLWIKADNTLLAKRVREFADRLEGILTLWCRLQAW